MSRYIPRTERPQVYESVLPAQQLKIMVEGLLRETVSEGSEIAVDTKRLTWYSGVAGKYFAAEKRTLDDAMMGAAMAHYLLDEFVDHPPKDGEVPRLRFIATEVKGGSNNHLSIVNRTGNQLRDAKICAEVTRVALGALTHAIQPETAWSAVNVAMDEQYLAVVGDYLFSRKLYDGGVVTPIDSHKALQDYMNKMLQIPHEVLRDNAGDKYHLAVIQDAIDSSPRRFAQDRFQPVDMLAAIAAVETDIA